MESPNESRALRVTRRKIHAITVPAGVALMAAIGLASSAPASASETDLTPVEPFAPPKTAEPAKTVKPIRVIANPYPRHAFSAKRVVIFGNIRPVYRGAQVQIQRRQGKSWVTVKRVRTGGLGGFRAVWHPGDNSVADLRARVTVRHKVSSDRARGLEQSRPKPVRETDLYSIGRVARFTPGGASFYGPGLYGGGLACGGSLSTTTRGVAHKYLPCGTKVTLYYHGRTVTTRVIDRGPYIAGRDWDLTSQTKRDLGFGSTGTIGAAW